MSLKQSANKLNNRVKYMGPAIHKNCKITGVETGDNYIDIFIENAFKEQYKDRVFIPNLDSEWIKTEEDKQKQISNFEDKLVQYLLIYMNADDIPDTSDMTHKQILDLVKGLLLPQINSDTTFAIKLIPDKKSSFARSPKFAPYVEKMEEDKPVSLSYTKWELDNLFSTTKEEDVTLPEKENDTPLF